EVVGDPQGDDLFRDDIENDESSGEEERLGEQAAPLGTREGPHSPPRFLSAHSTQAVVTVDREPDDHAEQHEPDDLSTAVVLFHEAIAQRLGLSAADLKALGLIMRDGPLTAGALAQRTGLTPGAVTGLVDRLEHAG